MIPDLCLLSYFVQWLYTVCYLSLTGHAISHKSENKDVNACGFYSVIPIATFKRGNLCGKINFPYLEDSFIDFCTVSSKIYDKQDDLNFEIVNFPFLDGDVPRSPSYGVYISQRIRFARVCSNIDNFNNRNFFLIAKLLKQGYSYHKILNAFSKFYHRHSELIVKYDIGLKTLLQQGISEPIFYGDLVYKFKRIVGKPNFSDQFKEIVKRYIRVGYNWISCDNLHA